MGLAGKAVLLSCGIVMTLPQFTPVAEAKSISFELSILPLQCSIERIDDGINELFRVVPEKCSKFIASDEEELKKYH